MKSPRKALAPATDLRQALLELLLNPRATLWRAWSWKAAILSAFFRSGLFFLTNLKAGDRKAIHAFLVEAVFAVFATGFMGAVSQHLRNARPVWATATVVWIAMPAASTVAQFAVHRAAKTPHLGTGIALTFCLAAIAGSYSWYAMKNGALLGGADQTTIEHDIKTLPKITLSYLLAPYRLLRHRS